MKKRMAAFFVVLAILAAPAIAQDKSADANMQILRDPMHADAKAGVAANMRLTDAEAKARWPVDDTQQGDSTAIDERIGNAILACADACAADPTARSAQIERKIRAAVRHQCAADIPLVQ